MNSPFTEKEDQAMDYLGKAHNLFVDMEKEELHGKGNHNAEWSAAMNVLQSLIVARMAARVYPKHVQW